jgi:DNA-binding MarR family transcriptional regulator
MRPQHHPPARLSNQRATSGQPAENVTAQDIHWLLIQLRDVVATSTVVWAGRGMTLVQLTVLHLISALAPMTLTELAQALGTRPPATSAMVDRLIHAGLVHRTPDPHDHRRVQLTITAAAQHIVGDTDPDTARRLHTVLKGINPQTRRHVIDVLIDTVRRSVNQPRL